MDISSRMFLAKQSKFTQSLASPFKSSLQQGKQSIDFVLDAIDVVRLHRSYTYKKLACEKMNRSRMNSVKQQLNNMSDNILNYPYLGSRAERRILSTRLATLSQDDEPLAFSKQLVIHGQAIRLLIFCCDSAVLRSINTDDLCMKEYHAQWQSILDTIDALTQYRICIGSVIEHGLRNPKLLLGRANNLLNKVKRCQDITDDSNQNLQQAIHQLEKSTQYLVKDTTLSALRMYQDTSDISNEIIITYKKLINHQLNRQYTSRLKA
ncbi:hypothetical protein [Vibrio ezurae]|uniref:Uncharacterized protein n=1 Tax=Vibrio ezurae NBRC 102218 TaxID=1219080 RepID=U3B1H0_9VIBR|nr:hypothetical protein [Vibrio ezurae]GAD79800.1 hypothetical protein VEZ01S_20_00720 [Vibrio ezurae NBRC 102218]